MGDDLIIIYLCMRGGVGGDLIIIYLYEGRCG